LQLSKLIPVPIFSGLNVALLDCCVYGEAVAGKKAEDAADEAIERVD
jgi:hypothetical protein